MNYKGFEMGHEELTEQQQDSTIREAIELLAGSGLQEGAIVKTEGDGSWQVKWDDSLYHNGKYAGRFRVVDGCVYVPTSNGLAVIFEFDKENP